jgi:hypothetical protein
MFQHYIHTAAARPSAKGRLQIGKLIPLTSNHHFHVPRVGISHPASQPQLGSFPLHEPAKPDSLHATFHQIMQNHVYLLNPIHIRIQDKSIANRLSA